MKHDETPLFGADILETILSKLDAGQFSPSTGLHRLNDELRNRLFNDPTRHFLTEKDYRQAIGPTMEAFRESRHGGPGADPFQ